MTTFFFIFLDSHTQLESLLPFMNTISPTIKNTFTYSKQTVSFLDVQVYLYESRKFRTKLYRKPTDCMTLLHFYSHHPLSCKESIIYSQVLQRNMIISEDHMLARTYPLHLIIKNIKKALIFTRSNLLYQQTPHTDTNILRIITSISDIGKSFIATTHKN